MENRKGYKYIVVDLLDNWNAKGGEFTSDYFNGPGFNWDALYIPDDAKVILNMNGFTINRGLKDWQYNGEVMYVDENAEIIIWFRIHACINAFTHYRFCSFNNCND